MAHPGVDAGVVLVLLNHDSQLALPFLLLLGIGQSVRRHGNHVLDKQDTELVTGAVEEIRLDLDVLAQHVKTEALQLLQVIHEGLVVGRNIDAVRPEALVQGTELEEELPVDQGPLDAVDLTAGDRAEASVGCHLVVADGDAQVVAVTWR